MGGIQTGLTDAQLLASQLKAHELTGMNSSASEIDNIVTNGATQEDLDALALSSGGAMELIQTIEVTSAVSNIDIINLPDGIYEIRAVGLTSSVDSYLHLRAFNGAGNVLTGTEYSYSGINSKNSLFANAYNDTDHKKAALGVVSAGTKANVNIKFSVSSVNKYLMAETLLFNYLYYPAYCVLGADVTTDKVTGIRIFESAGSIVAGTVYIYKLKV